MWNSSDVSNGSRAEPPKQVDLSKARFPSYRRAMSQTFSTNAPAALIVMGVAGCEKCKVGELRAGDLDWPFREGDSFHPPANVEKMRSGVPLTDEDRWPWLRAIAAWIDERR